MADSGYRLAEEGGAEALELFDGVGCVEDGCWLMGVSCWLEVYWVLAEVGDNCVGRGLGRVDDGEGVVECGEGAADCGLDQRVVGATEE